MTKKIVRPAGSAPAAGPYSHAVRVGDLLFCAGQVPVDPSTGQLVPGDIRAQTERVLQNINLILQDQGLSFQNVVKSTVYLTNLGDFTAMNETYGAHFKSEPPARTTVEVSALPRGATIEIEVIAHF